MKLKLSNKDYNLRIKLQAELTFMMYNYEINKFMVYNHNLALLCLKDNIFWKLKINYLYIPIR